MFRAMSPADGLTKESRAARGGADATAPAEDAVERLNRGCSCITVNEPALRRALEADLAAGGLPAPLVESHPHLFAESPVFLSRRHVARMAEIIGAAEGLLL
jgi:hypothetical protein